MIEIGFPPLDSDHRYLMAMLDELARAARDGADALLLEDQSLEVAASLESHFAKEERMLEECLDAKRSQHMARHADLLDRMNGMNGQVLSALGPEGAYERILSFANELAEEVEAFDLDAVPGIIALQKS